MGFQHQRLPKAREGGQKVFWWPETARKNLGKVLGKTGSSPPAAKHLLLAESVMKMLRNQADLLAAGTVFQPPGIRPQTHPYVTGILPVKGPEF